ncbi:Brf1-like TBP-binding domain containing protein [Naviculisporaceae sp. PSN 640]
MLSSAASRLQNAIGGSGKSKPKPKKINPVRRVIERQESAERRARASSTTTNTPAAPRTPCPNPACPKPNVVDGTCQTCGSVADDSNIVAEITFGEASNGAAVVQGNYIAADQGGVRGAGGLAFRRVAGSGASEARERSLREAKALLNQFAQQLKLSQPLADTAYRFYRVASTNNFVQGRRKTNVAAICLYAACRKDYNNKTMLIDLADLIKTDVFLLGRGYKEFLNSFPDMKEGTKPIILEDLIFRFASKLELHHDTNKIAETAVRIVAQMRYNHMSHGRRPAGLCGAAVILAARAHSYRRAPMEVQFIAKVTTATLQERMEEFGNVPSAQMTIKEFHEKDYTGPAHDPPFVYKNTEEWKAQHPSRPRKRKAPMTSTDSGDQEGEQQQNRDKRPRVDGDTGQTPAAPGPSAPPANQNPPVIDKDGFVVPPLPQHLIDPALTASQEDTPQNELPLDNATVLALTSEEEEPGLQALAASLGDADPDEEDDEDDEEEGLDPSSEMAMAVAQGIVEAPVPKKGKKGGKKGPKAAPKRPRKELPVDEEWEMDERRIGEDIDELLDNPEFNALSEAVIEERRARNGGGASDDTSASAESNDTPFIQPEIDPVTGRRPVSMDPIIHPDEFKDDPEIEHCLLKESEVRIKERIWSNHNKDYLRNEQRKIYNEKMAKNAPKKRRPRTRKPRIGEGASPAASAEEATANLAETRGFTTKLNYSQINLFSTARGPGSTSGENTPRTLGSVAGSEMGSDNEDDNGDDNRRLRSPTPQAARPVSSTAASAPAEEGEEGQGDDNDYHNGTEVHDEQGDDYNGYEDDYDPFDNNDGDEDGYDEMIGPS